MGDRDVCADVDVLIVGAGPTGLTAAIAARSHGLSVRIIDASPHRTPHSKALVLHSRSLEVFDDLGCIERLLSAGRVFRALNILSGERPIARIEFAQLDWHGAPYPMWFTIPQSSTERCLEEHLATMGTIVERETTARTLEQRDDAVDTDLVRAHGAVERCRASWVIGCDGARSDVRKMLGIELDGDVSDEVFVLADVSLESSLADAEGYNILSPEGVLLIVPLDAPGRVRIIAHMPQLRSDETPVIDLPMLQRLLDTRCGVATRLSSLGWTSHFSPKHFMAKRYRVGRVFLAGDAAHIHSPVGGQGLNTGVQDAYNLVWKLALAHRGQAASGLLDSYETERHAVAEVMIETVRRATRVLTLRGPLAQGARNRVGRTMFKLSRVRERMGRHVGMLHLRYPRGPAVGSDALTAFLSSGPRPGERAMLLASHPALSSALRGPVHTLLLFDGLGPKLVDADARAITALVLGYAGDLAHVVRVRNAHAPSSASEDRGVLGDPDSVLHRVYGAQRPLAVWVRPDKYVGFRGHPRATDELDAYLRGVYARTPVRPTIRTLRPR